MKFLKHNGIGVTVTDKSIEVVEVGMERNTPVIKNAARADIPSSLVEQGVIKDSDALREAFLQTLADAKPHSISAREVVFALPAPYAYVQLMRIQDESEEAIAQHIRDHVPLDAEDILFSYTTPKTQSSKGGSAVLALATSRSVVTIWQDFFESLKMTVSFDTATLSAYRALSLPKDSQVVGLVDMSGAAVAISIFSKNVLHYSHARRFFQDDKIITALAAEVKDAVTHVHTVYGKDVDGLVLIPPPDDSGDTKEQLEKALGVDVHAAASGVDGKAPVRLATVGLALRGLGGRWDVTDPLLTLKTAHTIQVSERADEKEEDGIETVVAEQREAKRLRKQKIMLGVLLLGGLLAVGGGFWFRSHEQAQRATELGQQTTNYTQTQSFDFSVSVATKEEDYADEYAAGRITNVTIEGAGDYQEAVANAKRSAEKGLAAGEVIWNAPVNVPADTTTVTFPLEIQWLIYSQENVDMLLLGKVDVLNTENVAYAPGVITVTDITKERDDLYLLSATVHVSLNEFIATSTLETSTDATLQTPDVSTSAPTDTATSTQSDVQQDQQMARVLDTPTGWLNVRSGPGTSYGQIDRVMPGEQYAILETSEEWYRIQVSDEVSGWVFSTYIVVE